MFKLQESIWNSGEYNPFQMGIRFGVEEPAPIELRETPPKEATVGFAVNAL
jgi:hypothetical protein